MKKTINSNIFISIVIKQLLVSFLLIIVGVVAVSVAREYFTNKIIDEYTHSTNIAIEELNKELTHLRNAGLYLIAEYNDVKKMNSDLYNDLSSIERSKLREEILSVIFGLTISSSFVENSCLYLPYSDEYIYSFSTSDTIEVNNYNNVFNQINTQLQDFYTYDGNYYFMVYNYFSTISPIFVYKLDSDFTKRIIEETNVIKGEYIVHSSIDDYRLTIKSGYETLSNKDLDTFKNFEVERGYIRYSVKDTTLYIMSNMTNFNLTMMLKIDITRFQPVYTHLLLIVIIYLMIIVITTFILIDNIYKKVMKPFKIIKNAMLSLQDGNLKTQIDFNEDNYPNEFVSLFNAFNTMSLSLNSYIEKTYLQEILLKNSEFKQLQAYINPHFLYNSFANLNQLCKLEDYESVKFLSKELSLYYMYVTKNNESLVYLEEEYEFVKNYLNIQKVRYKNRVKIELCTLDNEIKKVKVPKLIIQPLIENSYKYVFESMADQGIIKIDVKKIDNDILITVEDNGNTMTMKKIEELNELLSLKDIKVEKTGLINVCKRIELLYGDNSSYKLSLGELGGLKVELKIKVNM